ncbi:uncharacterized protein FOMMEDRAFT_28328 [Fomitiporia mediterranea MF3/22]|uniref:uncharacterized protein n=1 Tax=Fomitiporia mediterranea (strain MF3/22) TaxID=694068 RepID=UPI0004408D5B|nr:uncharacterized protein FOMMEDRAFT_28328 [Fomitiporia mediterranea MF3/22]EJD02596.1 hypothetical protein FOMMEDRAFT_28328 [Fomitiporia mediterranea MF3/22]
MSYANVAKENAPPHSQQPKPDPALLNTGLPTTSAIADDTAKVNIVPPNFKRDPVTVTSESGPYIDESSSEGDDKNINGSEKRKRRRDRQLRNAETEAAGFFAAAKEQLLRPGVAGGLIGVGYASYAFYANPSLRRDTRAISMGGISLLALFGLEGYAVERYAQTPRGRKERKRAREEGAALYRHSREIVLRPGVLGGLVGLVNVGILGGVGYAAYVNWDAPRWDRRVVSAVSVGLLGLWSAEGTVAEKYRESHK